MNHPNQTEILLVEDSQDDLDMTLRALRKANMANHIEIARDGAEALDFVFCEGAHAGRKIENIPKLILLDLKLPKIDGMEVLKRIKGDPRTKMIPVVVLTSSKEQKDEIESYGVGGNSYIVKPVDFESFAAVVQKLGDVLAAAEPAAANLTRIFISTAINILIVEDLQDDADMVLAELRKSGFDPKWKRVETEPDFLDEIKNLPDVILSDYSMPQFNGLRAAELLQKSGLDIPFILISGTVGEDVAVAAMKHGATDYLLKDRIARLGIAVEHALEQKRLRDESNRVEDERRASEARYRTLFDHAPDGIVIANPNSYYLDANASICRMLGYTRDEFIGLHASNIVAPSEIKNIASALSTIKSRTDYHREWQFRRKNGSVFPAEVMATAMPDGNLLGMIRDITERKQSEQELNIAHEKMRQLLAHSPAVIYTLKIDGETITPVVVSDNIERLLGFIAEEASTYNWWVDHLHPEDRERVLSTLQMALTQNGYSMEYRILHKDGTYRWVEDNNRLLRDTDGRPNFMVGVWTDISERKHAEEVLRKVFKQATGRKNVRVLLDLAVIFGLCSLSIAVMAYTDALVAPLEKLVFKFKNHLDDLFVPPAILLLGFFIFSYRRWRDAQGLVSEQANIQETLRKLHGELEKRIHQRTVELSQANESLRTEIAERKRAEEAQSQLVNIINSSDDAIIGKTLDGTITSWNHGAEKIFGYPAQEAIGRPMLMLFPPECVAEEHGVLARIARGENIENFETVRIRRDKKEIVVSVTISPVKDSSGKIVGSSKIARDITERKKADESLRLLKSAVEQCKDSVTITDAGA